MAGPYIQGEAPALFNLNPLTPISMKTTTLAFLGLSATVFTACAAALPSLKDAYADDFLIGAALNAYRVEVDSGPVAELVATQFNCATAENAMKWGPIHPLPGIYDFSDADRFADFSEAHGMKIVGHTLVWHSQTPKWVFEDENGQPLTREALLARMRDHIFTVMGRYKGRVYSWDVVNEALNEDGTLRDSPWRRIIGDDFIVKAFEFARQADPQAKLYYNDYGIENPAKRAGAVAIVKMLQQAGARIDGVGIQEHVSLTWPSREDLDASIRAFGELGVKVAIIEFDVRVLPDPDMGNADVGRRFIANTPALDPYVAGLPEQMQKKLADRYAELFGVYLANKSVVERVTFWGLTDRESWLNNFPVYGRTNYPLLFDRHLKAKPAFFSVIGEAAK